MSNLKKQKNKATEKNNKREDNGERGSEKNSETTNSHNKNREQDISNEIEPTNTSKSYENIEKTMKSKEKKMLLYKTKRYLQRKILLKVPQRNILVTIEEQIALKDRKIRNPC